MLNYITSTDEVVEVISNILNFDGEYIPLDTETTSLDIHSAKLLLLQFMLGDEIYVINAVTTEHVDRIIDAIIMTGATVIAHNAKYDANIVHAVLGREIKNWHDTMYTEVLLNAGRGKMFYSLNGLTEEYLQISLNKDVRMNFISKTDGNFTQEEIDYSAKDVEVLFPIMQMQMKRAKDANLTEVMMLERRLIAPVASMEYNGITLDRTAWGNVLSRNKNDMLKKYNELMIELMSYIDFSSFDTAMDAFDFVKIRVTTKKKAAKLSSITDISDIRDAVESEFNVNSNNQIKSIFSHIYNKELDSVGKKALNDLANAVSNENPIDVLLQYRVFAKKVSTYGTKFYNYINEFTGRIHPSFNNIGTVTGRFSSSKPNMQNIPGDPEYRHSFIARRGFKVLGIDYSQQEYRLAGALSGELAIINAYMNGLDMHTATAAILYDKPTDSISKKERSFGKTINFAILYGTTAWGIANNLKIPIGKAEEIMMQFFDGYPKLAKFKEKAEELILKLGYSITAMGRRRYNKELGMFNTPSDIRKHNSMVTRMGFNHIIQGTAADITKLAMVMMYERNPFGDDFKLILQVHDEIISEAREEIAEEAFKFQQEQMILAEEIYLGSIPAVADGYISDSWEKA